MEVPEEDDDDDEENGESMSDSTPNNHANGTSTYSEARFVPADPQVCKLKILLINKNNNNAVTNENICSEHFV